MKKVITFVFFMFAISIVSFGQNHQFSFKELAERVETLRKCAYEIEHTNWDSVNRIYIVVDGHKFTRECIRSNYYDNNNHGTINYLCITSVEDANTIKNNILSYKEEYEAKFFCKVVDCDVYDGVMNGEGQLTVTFKVVYNDWGED